MFKFFHGQGEFWRRRAVVCARVCASTSWSATVVVPIKDRSGPAVPKALISLMPVGAPTRALAAVCAEGIPLRLM